MRISKKHNNVTRQNITFSNVEHQNTNSYEEFYNHNLGPDFFDTRLWTESILKEK
ncbi:hypothetical protein [Desulfuribacillus alkaliarsenatis]|uniref:hypothetical protein n=1 Tax=Desulfuribacillus alkaliarsenatis TaxID=766136 RepID=UPI0015B5FB2A|nr:hypothetical protein [Desulfuribacillus alkaliarsenatis]